MIYLDIKKRTLCTLRSRRPFEMVVSEGKDIVNGTISFRLHGIL